MAEIFRTDVIRAFNCVPSRPGQRVLNCSSICCTSPPTEPSREWNCNLKLNAAWRPGKTYLLLKKMSTRNLQPTPKMISKSSVPIDLIYFLLCREFGDRSWAKTTDAQLVLVEVLSHPFHSTVEVKREILAIFRILLEALQPHLSQLKYYVSRQITVYSEARSSVLKKLEVKSYEPSGP